MSTDELKNVATHSSYITVPQEEIPVDLMRGLPRYSVTLVGLPKNYAPRHCGVGTLVRFREKTYILTAAHCARPLAEYGEIAIPVGAKYYIRFPVTSPIFIGKRSSEEWGPDLAFLQVSPVRAQRVAEMSHGLFYEIERYAQEMLGEEPPIDRGLWAIVGTPACESDLTDPKNLKFSKMTYSVGIESPEMRDDFDYIRARADLRLNNVPSNFKGISGGGLWRVDVGRKPDGTLVLLGEPRLEGCAFYETAPEGNYVYIRCHGRRSIYKHALDSLLNRS